MSLSLRGAFTVSPWAQRLLLFIATLALWLASANLPGPPITNLDSWHTILVDARIHHRQFGPDLVFTYGPWSFLSLSGYLPAALPEKFAWEIVGKLLLSVTIVALSASLPGLRRAVFLAALTCGIAYFDNAIAVVLTLLTLFWLLPAKTPIWQQLLAILWLSFLAHFKFTFCLQAVLGLGIAIATACAERRFRTAVTLFVTFALAYTIFWLAAGQPLAHLPAFWRLSWEISTGYGWAMSATPTAPTLIVGLLVAAICGVFLLMIRRASLAWTQRSGIALVLAASWFLAWKHGFTRADEHVFAFFYFCLFIGLAIPALCSRRAGWPDLNAVICTIGIALTGLPLLTYGPRVAWDHWQRFPSEFFQLDAWSHRFTTALQETKNHAHDPALVAAVGDATVDLLNFDQWLLLLNDLNYHPRPIPQSYSAYTPALLEANQRFFENPQAPAFVVARLDTIDGRYPGQEDSLALLTIARRYDIQSIESHHTILRRKPAASVPPPPAPVLLDHATPHYGDELAVPDAHDHAIWLEIDFRPTWLGRLHTLLYHASLPTMIATLADGHQKRFRILPSTSPRGFFIHPLIETHADLAALLERRATHRPASVRFELARPFDRFLWRRPRVRFFALPDLPLSRSSLPEQRDSSSLTRSSLREQRTSSSLTRSSLREQRDSSSLTRSSLREQRTSSFLTRSSLREQRDSPTPAP